MQAQGRLLETARLDHGAEGFGLLGVENQELQLRLSKYWYSLNLLSHTD